MATLQFVLTNSVASGEMYFTINSAIKTDSAGNVSSLNSGTDSLEIVSGTTVVQSAVGSKRLVVYPNPANNKITIQSSAELGSIRIFNSLGEIVFQTESNNLREQIDVSNFDEGIYILKIQNQYTRIIKH